MSMREATRIVRAGLVDGTQGTPFLPGPTFAAPYHLTGDPATSAYSYARYHNPTWTHYERALSDLEGGTALVFSSGMAAITAGFCVSPLPGECVLLSSSCYLTAPTA